MSPLWIASHAGHTEVVKLLVDSGARVDLVKTHDERLLLECVNTPLYIASEMGHTEVVKLLVNGGATIDPKGHSQNAL